MYPHRLHNTNYLSYLIRRSNGEKVSINNYEIPERGELESITQFKNGEFHFVRRKLENNKNNKIRKNEQGYSWKQNGSETKIKQSSKVVGFKRTLTLQDAKKDFKLWEFTVADSDGVEKRELILRHFLRDSDDNNQKKTYPDPDNNIIYTTPEDYANEKMSQMSAGGSPAHGHMPLVSYGGNNINININYPHNNINTNSNNNNHNNTSHHANTSHLNTHHQHNQFNSYMYQTPTPNQQPAHHQSMMSNLHSSDYNSPVLSPFPTRFVSDISSNNSTPQYSSSSTTSTQWNSTPPQQVPMPSKQAADFHAMPSHLPPPFHLSDVGTYQQSGGFQEFPPYPSQSSHKYAGGGGGYHQTNNRMEPLSTSSFQSGGGSNTPTLRSVPSTSHTSNSGAPNISMLVQMNDNNSNNNQMSHHQMNTTPAPLTLPRLTPYPGPNPFHNTNMGMLNSGMGAPLPSSFQPKTKKVKGDHDFSNNIDTMVPTTTSPFGANTGLGGTPPMLSSAAMGSSIEFLPVPSQPFMKKEPPVSMLPSATKRKERE
ncbi:hypothetical protein SAMD00019534_111620 [Acytostelium subglobosum LB1]|uniref:hypothetical protein n=1 Tax=Acytostelium subglobosum LB1 TaxID=1410327 RepID=UPI00064486FD|nr:hypothetical protein SAMD00019534_111620 [Acytostelium subglobosum LB1]GAM27986.1 hypothetical protein SAMD00019534_111620 [Acytostelium subglobosum LB1]|eukprot:XP_012748945.1 hypothetical protein SAMD00019534_111620 [Acytostelium subglobosum LB1]